jgi:molecular chaperone GrpE
MTDQQPDTQAAAEQAAAEPQGPVAEPEAPAAEPQAADAQMADAAPQPEEALADDAAVEAPEPDWHDRYLRAAAELENVRKRARRDISAAEARGIAKLARELLPALDDLDRALAHAEAQEHDEDHHLTAGIRAVQQQLLHALTRIGITSDSPKGEPFDPHRHEAVSQQPAPEGVESGTVIEVFQPGYVYADTVLRAAKVVVAA